MKILVVCAHHMNRMGVLNAESKGRCKIASNLYRKHKYNKIIVPGWAYRDDSQFSISSRMKNYLVNRCYLNSSKIIEEPRSRDTVGDAIFSRLLVNNFYNQITNLTVVTSEYHVSRAIKIFQFVFGEDIQVDSLESFGIKINCSLESNEMSSLEAFKKTFSGVAPGDFKNILEIFLSNHPLYNGEKFSKLNLNDCFMN